MFLTQTLRRVASLAMTAGLIGLSTASNATELEDLGLEPELEAAILAMVTAPATGPGASFGSPMGFGASLGDVYVGIGGAETTTPAASEDVDGSMVVGFGLGDAKNSIGADINVGIISLTDSFGDDLNINFKLHTQLAGGWGLAAGVENLGRKGLAENLPSSHYMVVTKATALRPSMPSSPLTLVTNIGIGDNRFDDFGGDGMNVFGSVGLNFTRRIGGIIDWTGRQLNVGASFVPFQAVPLSLTVGATNVTEEGGNDMAFGGSLGFAFNYLK